MKIYLVGGAVRDTLLGLPVKEKDWVVVGATPKDMLERGFKPVGKDFPVFIHPNTGEEYALARTERKTGRGYTGFTFHTAPDVTLEQDLSRRDLTINAIAQDPDGTIIDPYHGCQDIRLKIFRHVSPAFTEDPLRILRVARFMARFSHLGFAIADQTAILMRKMVREGDVDALVPERIWKELARALSEPSPEKFFEVLCLCGALRLLIPEIDQLFGVPAKTAYHPEIDTGLHTLMALQQAVKLSNDPEIAFAVLLHDLGKGLTAPRHWPSHVDHDEKGVSLVKAVCGRLAVPHAFKELALIVTKYHIKAHRVLEMKASTVVALLESLDVYRRPQRFEKFLLACEADIKGRKGFENADYQQGTYLRAAKNETSNIDIQAIIDSGITGAAIKNELHRLRVKKVRDSRALSLLQQSLSVGSGSQ